MSDEAVKRKNTKMSQIVFCYHMWGAVSEKYHFLTTGNQHSLTAEPSKISEHCYYNVYIMRSYFFPYEVQVQNQNTLFPEEQLSSYFFLKQSLQT